MTRLQVSERRSLVVNYIEIVDKQNKERIEVQDTELKSILRKRNGVGLYKGGKWSKAGDNITLYYDVGLTEQKVTFTKKELFEEVNSNPIGDYLFTK